MKVSSFWIILLRLIGLYFLYLMVLGFLMNITSLFTLGGIQGLVFIVGIALVVMIALFVLVLKYLVMQPTFLIEKLRLTSHFEEESFQISSDKTSLIQVAIIIIGGLTLMDGIPGFVRTFISMMQNEMFFNENPELPNLIQDFALFVMGFLLVTRSRGIAKWIDHKSIIHSDTLD